VGKFRDREWGIFVILDRRKQFHIDSDVQSLQTRVFPATVEMTSCDYGFTLGLTTGGVAGTYTLPADLECDVPGDEVHLTVFADAGHTNRICSITFRQQTSITGLHATNSGGSVVIVSGTATGITATHLNESGCPGHVHTAAATYKVNVEVKGDNGGGAATGIGISH
jgi:hypothetical protein